MLILKGNQGKSRIIDLLGRNLLFDIDYVCFEYVDEGDKPVIDGSTYVTSSECTLMEFVEYIDEYINESKYDYIEYIFIYTNKCEDEIQDIVQWLADRPYCINIMLTCR